MAKTETLNLRVSPKFKHRLVEEARNVGLNLNGPINYRCDEPVVHWERVDRRYTFMFLVLQKASANSNSGRLG